MASHMAPKDAGSASSGQARRRGARGVALVAAIVLAVLVAVGGTCAFLLYRSATVVRAEASELTAVVDPLKEALKSGDEAAINDAVGAVEKSVSVINDEIHGPLWSLASLVPVVGQDVRSAQTLGEVGSQMVDEVLVPVAAAVSGTGVSGLVSEGAVDVETLREVTGVLVDAIPAIREAARTVSELPEATVPQLREILGRVQEPLGELEVLLDGAQPFLEALPAMLGGDGARIYLVIAQNNAELRSTGGLPGSWGTLEVRDGVIEMGGEFDSILHDAGLKVDITNEEAATFDINMDTDPAQVNYTPDFTRVGELASQYWEQKGYGRVDGVVAVDPVFLQWLLGLTGGFEAPDGTFVDGSNAAKALLSDTYWRLGNDGEAQDAYFSAVAALAFGRVMDGLGDIGLSDLAKVVTRGGGEGRLLVWMADEREQAAIDGLGLSGALESDPATPVLGVYLNDDTYSKLSWYAACSTAVGEGVRNDDGTTTYDVTTTLTNTMTPEEAAEAPIYIYGGNDDKRERSDMLNHVFFFAPAGGSISGLRASDGSVFDGYGFVEGSLEGLQVFRTRTHLRAGESAVFTYQVTVPSDAESPLTVRTTPLAQESLMGAADAAA